MRTMEEIRRQSTEDKILALFLKTKMIMTGSDGPRGFLQSQDVYCKNPWTHFNTREPIILHDGRYFLVNYRTVNSGRTDGCESGCWRVMGRDKVIKSQTNGKILGLSKVYKFCEKDETKSVFKFWEKEKREERDKRIWVMEEYRLASQWKQDYVICKIQLLQPNPLEVMMCNHIRGY